MTFFVGINYSAFSAGAGSLLPFAKLIAAETIPRTPPMNANESKFKTVATMWIGKFLPGKPFATKATTPPAIKITPKMMNVIPLVKLAFKAASSSPEIPPLRPSANNVVASLPEKLATCLIHSLYVCKPSQLVGAFILTEKTM